MMSNIPNNAVVLVSTSEVLTNQLSAICTLYRVETVEQLPRLKQLKAVLLDAEYARIVDVSWLRRAYPTSFIAIYDPSAAFNPFFRLSCFEAGANMVGHDVASIATALTRAVLPPKGNGAFTCPYCRLGGLTEGEMHMHIPTYHINWPYEVHVTSQCPICRKALHRTPLQVHIHEEHQPQQPVASSSSHSYSSLALPYSPSTSLNNPSYMPQPHTPSPPSITQLYHFALVLVRHPQYPKYLLVQEFGNLGFWVPGGGVDKGETFSMAAVREVKEETGVDVQLTGILGMDYHALPPDEPSHSSSSTDNRNIVRMRVIFIATPLPLAYRDSGVVNVMDSNGNGSMGRDYTSVYSDDNLIPKSLPDFESGGACWVDYQDIQAGQLKMRGHEPKRWSRYIEEGGTIYPLSFLSERSSESS